MTGATGYIGNVVCEKLQAHDHTVVGLARSAEAATKLEAKGVAALRGSLQEPQTVVAALPDVDAVIHSAMEWSPEAGAVDRAFVEAVVPALYGTKKAFLTRAAAG